MGGVEWAELPVCPWAIGCTAGGVTGRTGRPLTRIHETRAVGGAGTELVDRFWLGAASRSEPSLDGEYCRAGIKRFQYPCPNRTVGHWMSLDYRIKSMKTAFWLPYNW